MAINIDKDLLNDTSRELLDLLNDKDYKNSIKLINKEIRYLNDQIKRNRKLSSLDSKRNEISDYMYEREEKSLSESIKELKDFKKLVYKAQKNPKAVRLNAGIYRFNTQSQKIAVRKANIKKARTTKIYYAQKVIDYVEIFYTNAQLKSPKFKFLVEMEPQLNVILEKYLGRNYTDDLKKRLVNVSPYNMTNGVEEEVSKLSEEYIDRIKTVEVKTKDEADEIETALYILSKVMKGI